MSDSTPRYRLEPGHGLGRHRSLHLEIFGRRFAPAFDLFVLDFLALIQGAQTGLLDRRDMYENIFAAALRCNKPVTFGRVEPFHGAGRQFARSPKKSDHCTFAVLHLTPDRLRVSHIIGRPAVPRPS